MWTIIATLCFMGMALSPETPLCFQQARVPMNFDNKSSCILVADRLAKDLDIDFNARNIMATLYCVKLKKDVKGTHSEQIKS
jgi:hypothetical protein